MEKNIFKRIVRGAVIAVITGVIFLAATLPFRDILSVFTVSEVRPAAVLNPFLGMSFGIPAAIGIAIANLIADGMSGYPAAVLIEGLIPQFLYTFIPYILWKQFTKGEDHIHRLNSVSRVLKYTAIVLVYAILSGICVGLIVQLNFGADFLNCAFFVFLNNFTMSMVIGCPLLIVMNLIMASRSGNDRRLSVNEKIIVASAIFEIILIVSVIFITYISNPGAATVDLWNTIYINSTIEINIFMGFALSVMIIVEKTMKKMNG